MKRWLFIIGLPIIFLFIMLSLFWPGFWWSFIIIGPLFLLGLYNIFQRKHTVLRNFPLLAYYRYFSELIRPEIHQYFVESDIDGRPFSRERRSVIYQRAKGVIDTMPYGTRWKLSKVGYEWINHSLKAKISNVEDPRVMIGNEQCSKPYNASILNVSAMSFGALSPEAVMALNWGAKVGNFYQNTGEGGLAPYHLKYGGNVVWQIGTAYFGCRTPEGLFSPEYFEQRAKLDNVKMIEIKLSQGAKPGHGGILPGKKLTKEIAEIRCVPMGKDVISPRAHTTFSDPIGLIHYIQQLRQLSGGKPVGFKLCVGSLTEFMAICKAMLETKIYPDFITVDGGEGGTGAAPVEFSNAVGSPLVEGLIFVHNALVGINVRDKVRLICSGRLVTGFQIVQKLAIGADLCNSARAMLMAVGCVQSLKCNTNRCPTGVTTQDSGLRYGLAVNEKYKRVARYHQETVKSVMEIVGAAGLDSPSDLTPRHIFRRISQTEVCAIDQIYPYVEPGDFLRDKPLHQKYEQCWREARPDTFSF